MTKDTAIRNYRKYSMANAYIIGFVYLHNVYTITVKEIAPRFIRVERASTKKGGGEKLQLRITSKQKQSFIKHGAQCIGNEQILIGRYNKGVEFERLISELNGIEYHGKDNVPFYVDGDLRVGDISYQIKLEGAQIVTFDTLEKLKKRA